nr:E3 ubiquitin-protein ligase RHF2A-like [Ipomoea batatas]
MEEGKVSENQLTSAAAFVEGGIQDACDDACSICLEAFSDSDPSTFASTSFTCSVFLNGVGGGIKLLILRFKGLSLPPLATVLRFIGITYLPIATRILALILLCPTSYEVTLSHATK